MNKLPRDIGASRPLDIGAEPDFSLGGLSVRPSLREVSAGGAHEIVEPRVMQVLVALVRAEGNVVSRDRLIELCWGGRLVGDDAINSCAAKVRALAVLASPSAFEIETIPRVGYRLRARGASRERVAFPGGAPLEEKRAPLSWRFVALAAGVAIAIAGAAIFFFTSRPREWVVVESRLPFIATPLVERSPTFSPDGTMIAYTAGIDLASRKIYLRLLNGGDPIQLTHDSLGALSPAWSSDGSTIAYVSYESGKPCRIMLIAMPAGSSRQVGRCRTSEVSFPAWDHGGHALFFVDSAVTDGPEHIFRLDLDSGGTAEFVHAATGATEDSLRSISPDGRTMLLVRSISGAITQVVLHPLPDGSERVLLQGGDDIDGATWSSDSSAVFVARPTQWDTSVWAYPLSGAAQRIMTSPVGINTLASGPDGLLALDLEFSESALAVAPLSADQPPNILDQNGLHVTSMDYARDGTLAVIARHSGEAGIWLAEPGKPLHQLLRLPVCGCGLRWSPDGTRFSYFVTTSDGFRVSVLTRGGAPVAQVVSAHDIGSVDWSADGNSLLMTRRDAKGWRLWRTDLTRPDKSVPVSPYGWKFVRVSGNMMFGVKSGATGIWRMDGKPRRLTDWPDETGWWAWTVAGDRIVYPDLSNPAHPRFMALPVTGGTAAPLGYASGMVKDSAIAVDPKSRRAVYLHQTRQDADIGWIRLARR